MENQEKDEPSDISGVNPLEEPVLGGVQLCGVRVDAVQRGNSACYHCRREQA